MASTNQSLKSLKKAILDLEEPAYRFFLGIGINPSRGSQIVCGIVNPTEDEKQKIARRAKRDVAELFAEIKE